MTSSNKLIIVSKTKQNKKSLDLVRLSQLVGCDSQFDAFRKLADTFSTAELHMQLLNTTDTLLHLAIANNNMLAAKYLINRDVDVNARVSSSAMTALHAAIIWNKPAMEAVLIEAKADTSLTFRGFSAHALKKKRAALQNKAGLNLIHDAETLRVMIKEVSFMASSALVLANQRLGELTARHQVAQTAKKVWFAKQSGKVKLYRDELKRAQIAFERVAHVEEAKRAQVRINNLGRKSYLKTLKVVNANKVKHRTLQLASAARAQRVLKSRVQDTQLTSQDPFAWLKDNDGLVKNQVSRH